MPNPAVKRTHTGGHRLCIHQTSSAPLFAALPLALDITSRASGGSPSAVLTCHNTKERPMTVNHEKVREMAAAYTAAWNSGSPDAVASFYAPDGKIVINRGQPWVEAWHS